MPLFPGAPGDCIMLRPVFFRRSCESRNPCPQRFRFLPAQERRISVNITSHGLIQRFLRFLRKQERRIAFNPSAIALRVQGQSCFSRRGRATTRVAPTSWIRLDSYEFLRKQEGRVKTQLPWDSLPLVCGVRSTFCGLFPLCYNLCALGRGYVVMPMPLVGVGRTETPAPGRLSVRVQDWVGSRLRWR